MWQEDRPRLGDNGNKIATLPRSLHEKACGNRSLGNIPYSVEGRRVRRLIFATQKFRPNPAWAKRARLEPIHRLDPAVAEFIACRRL